MNKFKVETGMFLVISLLLTSVLTATGIVLIKVTTVGKQVSDSYIQNTQLLNSAMISASIIEQATGRIVTQLNTNNANIYLVDTSSIPSTIVVDASTNSSTISNISQQLFNVINPGGTSVNTNNMTLIDNPIQQGNFNLYYQNLFIDPIVPTKAWYNLKITASICNQIGSCQETDKQIFQSRSCPLSANGKSMAPVLNAQLPTGYTNNFPNLYCTCSDPNFNKTTATGCVPAPCPDGQYNILPSGCAICPSGYYCTGGNKYPCTTANCQTCTATSCSVCNSNYYLFNSTTCNPCPTANVASCPANGSFTCNPGYYKNGANATSCTACNSIVGVTNCNSATGAATSCLAGYGLVSGSCNPCVPGSYSAGAGSGCIGCSSGYYTSAFNSTSCNTPCTSMSGVASCTSTGSIVSCNPGYGLVGGSCNPCAPGTYSTGAAACTSCMSTGVASCNSSNGQATGCTSGYNLSGGNCVAGGATCIATAGCQGGSSYMTGGYGAYLTTTPLCYCPSSISVWDLHTCQCININSCTSGYVTVEYPTDNNPRMNTSHGYYNFTIRIMCSPTCPAGATCYPKP